MEQELKKLAGCNACTARKGAKTRRFKLARDLAAVEKQIGKQLTIAELTIAAYQWHRLSQPFLDPNESREDHLMALVAEIAKVRFPTGEGAIKEAIERASRLPLADLPTIPNYPDASEDLRRIAALHRELSLLNGGQLYFLSYRDAAKVVPGLSPQQAYNRTFTLDRLDVIRIVDKGQPGPNGKAAEFLYLLPESEEGTREDDCGLKL